MSLKTRLEPEHGRPGGSAETFPEEERASGAQDACQGGPPGVIEKNSLETETQTSGLEAHRQNHERTLIKGSAFWTYQELNS